MSNIRRSDALPSLEAANQAQIDDLVQRNHTLESSIRKLSEQLTVEANRSKEAVLEIQKQWHEKERLLRDECEDFLAYYRFVQLNTVSALELERHNVLGEQKALRKEKLLRLQRDFRIIMFYAKERELEDRVVELEEENERIVEERKELASALRKKLADLVGQMQLKDAEIEDLHSERDAIEKDVSKLREENAHLHTSLTSMTSKLERITLQLEGAQSSRSEQEDIKEDLKRKNYDLQRQLDKWQRLENQGNAELESLRKSKSELDVEVKELHDRLAKATDENSKALDKEKKRTERLKEVVLEWQETAKEHQIELKDAKKEIVTLRREVEKLKAQEVLLDAGTAPPGSTKAASKSKKANSVTDSETEREVSKRSKPAPRRKKGTTSGSDTDDVQKLAPPPHKASKKTRKMTPVFEEEEISEIEEIPALPAQAEVARPKPKPKPKPRTKPTENLDDQAPATRSPLPASSQRKRKATSDDSDEESGKPGKKVAKTTSKSDRTRMTGAAAEKPTPPERSASIAADPVQKQKKRKVNLFADAGSQSNQLGFEFDLGTNGLNLPSSLAPVGDADGPVPNRAISGVMSGMGSLLRGRMGARR